VATHLEDATAYNFSLKLNVGPLPRGPAIGVSEAARLSQGNLNRKIALHTVRLEQQCPDLKIKAIWLTSLEAMLGRSRMQWRKDMADPVVEERDLPRSARRYRTVRRRSLMQFIPWFLYVLVAYVLIKLSGADLRAVLFMAYGYELTGVEILQLVAFLIAMLELLKVAHAGESNLVEALLMAVVWVIYLVFFVLGAAQVGIFAMFSSTEFLMLLLISGMQVLLALIINSRTARGELTDDRALL
jgi:hypothetical protein